MSTRQKKYRAAAIAVMAVAACAALATLATLSPAAASGSAAARPLTRPASAAELRAVAFADPAARRGYGLFESTSDGGRRCHALVGATGDAGRQFSPAAGALSWSCDASAPVESLADGGHGRVYLFGPALLASRDSGRSWARVRLGGPVLAVAAAGRSAWAAVARCPARSAGSGRPASCRVRLDVSVAGGRWHAAARQPAGASVPTFGVAQPGSASLVRVGAAVGYLLTAPAPGVSGAASAARLWVTRDGGARWASHRVRCGIDALAAALAAGPHGRVYVACAGEPGAGWQAKSLAVSADGGRSWTVRAPCRAGGAARSSPVCLGYLAQLAAAPGGRVFLAGPRSPLLVTADAGRTWHAVRPAIGDGGGGTFQVLFAGRDGAVVGDDPHAGERPVLWRSTDGGARWRVVFPDRAAPGRVPRKTGCAGRERRVTVAR
jgi:photosystem II stability/assembly factor-like uncharacterized protein